MQSHNPLHENPMKILIRNIERSATESTLLTLFEAYGVVQSCDLVMDKETGLSKGFGFIEMPKQGDAKAAIKELNHQEINGQRIRVKKAEPKAGE